MSLVRLWVTGWLDELIILPQHHLRYPGFSWVPVPDPHVIRALVLVATIAAVLVAAGVATRLSALVFLLCFGWVELIEATTYLNHYWLMFSLFVLVALLPTDAALSVRAHRGGRRSVPAWTIWAFRVQVGAVYFFAGVAKLHHDWLVEAMPLRMWLPSRSDLPLIGPVLEMPTVAHVASVAGALFDLSIVPLLLCRKTRAWAFAGLVVFHLSTGMLLPAIGLFPLLMTLVVTVFFEPDWPRSLRSGHGVAPAEQTWTHRPIVAGAVACWLVIQLVLPVRHLVIPGDARWTGEGYRFAWNVVAIEKTASLAFSVVDRGGTALVNPADWFTPGQLRVASAEPDLILQMAHRIADGWPGGQRPAVHADVWVSFNGDTAVRLIEPNTDLASVELDQWSAVVAPPGFEIGW